MVLFILVIDGQFMFNGFGFGVVFDVDNYQMDFFFVIDGIGVYIFNFGGILSIDLGVVIYVDVQFYDMVMIMVDFQLRLFLFFFLVICFFFIWICQCMDVCGFYLVLIIFYL